MTLPLLLSVPHAGVSMPPELESLSILSDREIVRDGDEGASEIYDLSSYVDGFLTTPIARAFVDMNRAEDDLRRDGVVKTHTCWDVPIYREPLPAALVESLLDRYHRPYHRQLSAAGLEGRFRLGIDCHTMAAAGPPVGPDPGVARPWICLGSGDLACPVEWIETLKACFAARLDGPVTINEPFSGGYITRFHAREMPWIQLEMSRAPFLSDAQKREMVRGVLEEFVATAGTS